MQITFLINQSEAMRLGINAPAPVAILDLDPATLTQKHRDMIAAMMVDGHDITLRGLQTECEGWVGQHYRERDVYSNGTPTKPPIAYGPSAQHLAEALDRLATEVRAKQSAFAAKTAADHAAHVAGVQHDDNLMLQLEASRNEDLADSVRDSKWLLSDQGDKVQYGGKWSIPPGTVVYDAKNLYCDYKWRAGHEGLTPRIEALTERVKAWCREQNLPVLAEAKRLAAEANAKQKAAVQAAQAREAAKQQAAKDIILRLGSPVKQEGIRRGLLRGVMDTALTLAANEAFASVSWPEYGRLDDSEIEVEDGVETGDLEILRNDEAGNGLTDPPLDRYFALERVVKPILDTGAKLEIRIDSITYNSEDVAWTTRHYARLSIEHCGLPVHRDYSIA